jgi:hypothetical protein
MLPWHHILSEGVVRGWLGGLARVSLCDLYDMHRLVPQPRLCGFVTWVGSLWVALPPPAPHFDEAIW